ncbi:hypothetical protein PcaKH35_16700 [Parageobacillus caldoxylosilyticus]|nr:hypothetical protein PcaKH35_16700 [Parageobacillus caldoxylosilyticus]
MFLNLFTAVHERQEIPVPGTILLRGKTKKMKGLHQASRSDETVKTLQVRTNFRKDR